MTNWNAKTPSEEMMIHTMISPRLGRVRELMMWLVELSDLRIRDEQIKARISQLDKRIAYIKSLRAPKPPYRFRYKGDWNNRKRILIRKIDDYKQVLHRLSALIVCALFTNWDQP